MRVAVAVVRVPHQQWIVLVKVAWAAVGEVQEMLIMRLYPVMTDLAAAAAADR